MLDLHRQLQLSTVWPKSVRSTCTTLSTWCPATSLIYRRAKYHLITNAVIKAAVKHIRPCTGHVILSTGVLHACESMGQMHQCRWWTVQENRRITPLSLHIIFYLLNKDLADGRLQKLIFWLLLVINLAEIVVWVKNKIL